MHSCIKPFSSNFLLLLLYFFFFFFKTLSALKIWKTEYLKYCKSQYNMMAMARILISKMSYNFTIAEISDIYFVSKVNKFNLLVYQCCYQKFNGEIGKFKSFFPRETTSIW